MVKQEIDPVRAVHPAAETSSSVNPSGFTRRVSVLYSFVFINLMRLFFYVGSIFNEKTRRGLRGRKNLFIDLKKNIVRLPAAKRIWFHASSLGEFEQAKPIIEILKRSGYGIIVSFFSPSGYEHSLNYPNADIITYIPLDSARNAHRFVQLVKPNVVVVMRYDLWINHLIAAKEFGAKIIVADATFSLKLFNRADFLRSFYRQLYLLVDLILATTSEHKKMFDFFLGKSITSVAGDTRFDRVYSRSVSNDAARSPLSGSIRFEKTNAKGAERVVMVLGSTWREDTEVIGRGLRKLSEKFPELYVMIVPHEPTVEEVRRLHGEFPEAKILSEVDDDSRNKPFNFYIVDRVGLLTQLYVLGDIAYVGGGFGAGVHSVLEPAVYGIPIITGPRIERSDEAMQLMQEGALFFVKDVANAYKVMLKMVQDESARKKAGKIAKSFVDRHLGASSIVAEQIMKACFD